MVDHEAETLAPSDSATGGLAEDATELAIGEDPSAPSSATRARALRRGQALGRYLIVDLLGRGGMGVVYSAYDPQLDRKVAIKVLRWREGGARVAAGRARLEREAQAMAKLSHRNVVAVHDVGTYRDSVFVAMEFIEGRTAAAWIEEPAHADRSWREVLEVFLAAGEGLAAAHSADIIHRDFKPENVMVAESGRVVVLDFGLARPTAESEELVPSASRDEPERRLTVTGALMGTPAYMSPEQLAGKPTDARTDQFSFCVSLYYALYGERPFEGDTLAELTANVMSGEPPRAPRRAGVPAWIRRVLLVGLARDPADRHPSMAALLETLRRDPARRRRRIAGGVVGVGLLGLAAVGARGLVESDPCASVGDAIEAAWGPERRDAVQAAFARDARPVSGEAWARLSAFLDDYAAQWPDARRAACEGTRDPSVGAGLEASQRATCLDASLRRVDALTTVLTETDDQTVLRVLDVLEGIPTPARCGLRGVYRLIAPVPADEDDQRAAEEVRAHIERARVLLDVGRVAESRRVVEEALERAKSSGYAPLEAEASLQLAKVELTTGDFQPARGRLEKVLDVARIDMRDDLALTALGSLAVLDSRYRDKRELPLWQLAEARAIAKRTGLDAGYLAGLDVQRAIVLLHGANPQQRNEAIASLDHALDVFRELERGVAFVDAATTLVSALLRRRQEGDVERAGQLLREARDVAIERGRYHPAVAVLDAQLGRMHVERGELREGVELLRGAHEVFVAAVGERHVNTIATANALGRALEGLGRADDAEFYYRRAIEYGVAAFGERKSEVSISRNDYGSFLRRAGRARQAEPIHRGVARILEAGREDDPGNWLAARELVADDLRVAGDLEAARAIYEDVLERRRVAFAGEDSTWSSYARAGLALTRLALGESDGAAATARQAVQELATAQRARSSSVSVAVRFVGAYVARATGDHERAAELAAEVAAVIARDAPGPLQVSFEAWRGGQDVVPNY